MIVDTTNDMLPAYGVRLFAGKMLLELDNDDSSVRIIYHQLISNYYHYDSNSI